MEKENKWEYDYSSLYNNSSDNGGTGYANVGSSGSNAANQYDASGAGGQPDPGQAPKKRRRISAGRILRTVVSLVLAAAVGFAGGYVGSMVGNNHKLVIQAADRTEQLNDALASSTSTGGDNLTTAQVAAQLVLVRPAPDRVRCRQRRHHQRRRLHSDLCPRGGRRRRHHRPGGRHRL